MTDTKKTPAAIDDKDLDQIAGGQSGDDEAEDSIVVDYGAVKLQYAGSTGTTQSGPSKPMELMEFNVKKG